MPCHESGSLDHSERLRMSSLVDMSAEEDKYDLFGTASDLLPVDEMGSRPEQGHHDANGKLEHNAFNGVSSQ